MKAKLALLVGAASIAASTSAFADDEDRAAPAVKLLTTIPVPVDPAHPANPPVVPLKSFDISWIDADTQLYYLADRSNAAVDVADAKRNVFKKQIRPSGLHVPFKGVAAG